MSEQLFCDACEGRNLADEYCDECEEYLCGDCSTSHKKRKATRSHELTAVKNKSHVVTAAPQTRGKTVSPGKPRAIEILTDSITLDWDPPTKFGKEDCYRICYKDMNGDRKWRQFQEDYTTASATLTDLKSNAKYIFRVKVIFEDGEEGPYGPDSDEIETTASLAAKVLPFSKRMGKSDFSPVKYLLPITEVINARNTSAKTKKFEIGTPPQSYVETKTIMLVGATGTGKSTFVDGVINYVLGVSWDDQFRFTIVDLEDEEKERQRNQALSQTEWITCYTIYPEPGSRLRYKLQIIDTPGFGDTRGLQRDQEIVGQIRQLFSESEPKGVTCIDAVCFLIKAPDARLTAVQSYIFQSIMSLFGKDIEKNICSLITFADGNDPPVLASLKESKLPFGEHFTFNNSGLFAKNKNLKSGSLSPMFWEMGLSSFRLFFTQLEQLTTKSLQLTKDVLQERYRLEAVVRNLQENLEIGLTMVKQLKQEKKVLEDHKSQIEQNKNFEYEVEESRQIKTLIPGGVHNTKCRDCFFRCHERCVFEDNEEKRRCAAMDSNGFCKACPDKCFWNKHFNDAFKYEHVTVKVKKTYSEMQEKYNEASGKVLTHKQIVEKNEDELKQLTRNIEDMMFIVKYCNERLTEIALRPNPLSMTEHIDLMIENEKLTKKEGYLDRIKILNEFRRDAEVSKSFDIFAKEANVTLGEEVVTKDRSKDIKSVYKRMTSWLKSKIPGFSV